MTSGTRVKVELGQVATFQRGTGITRAQTRSGSVPVVAGGRTPSYFHDAHNREGETIAVAGSGAFAGFVSYWTEPVFISDAFTVHPGERLVPKYLYYLLEAQQDALHAMKSSGGVPHVYPKHVARLEISVPDVMEQHRIVEVLDSFTALTRNLEQELTVRRVQYDHFRDEMLSHLSGSERTLADIAQVARGASPRPINEFLTDDPDGVPWIKIGDVPPQGKYVLTTEERITALGASKSRRVHPGDFILSNSMSFGRPYISKIEGCIHDGWLAISEFSEHVTSDYLYHVLRSSFVQRQFSRRAGSGSVSNLNSEIVKVTEVPVPSISEQARIVHLLDKFDQLINGEGVGLPAEIAARRRQYEHYRHRLLEGGEDSS